MKIRQTSMNLKREPGMGLIIVEKELTIESHNTIMNMIEIGINQVDITYYYVYRNIHIKYCSI